MIRLISGWALFFVITFSFLIPVICLTVGSIPVKCWEERRMGHNNKYQPSTIYVRVCEVGR